MENAKDGTFMSIVLLLCKAYTYMYTQQRENINQSTIAT